MSVLAIAGAVQKPPTAGPEARRTATAAAVASFERTLTGAEQTSAGGSPAATACIATVVAPATLATPNRSGPAGRTASSVVETVGRHRQLATAAAAPALRASSVAMTSAAPRQGDRLGAQVAAIAREYVGIRSVDSGTDPNHGLGRAEFIGHVFERIGVDLPDDRIAGSGAPVESLDAALPGDILIGASRSGTGAGIYVGNGTMVEADPASGQIRLVAIDQTPSSIRRVVAADASALSRGDRLDRSDLVQQPTPASAVSGATDLGSVPYADLFIKEGREHGVDPRLLAAVAWQESRYNPKAVSHAGAQGLMQIMPATARGLGVADSFDPAQAVDGAARLLSSHLRKYDGSVPLALAAYNAGGGAVDRFGGIPPYAETQHYVVAVQNRLSELSR